MTLNLAADAPLLQAFATLPDPRKSRNQGKLHDEAVNFFDQAIDFPLHETGCSYAKTIEKRQSYLVSTRL